MSRYTLYIMLIAVFVLGAAMPAFSQSVPSVKGLKAFAAETNYMSLPGFLRWKYRTQNGVLISIGEAMALVKSQSGK